MNKQILSALIILLCVFSGLAQVKVPFFGKINYLKGYVKEIRGENIGYFSALPEFATTALLTRCTDGKYDIEWETEAVPASFSNKFIYFAWVAAYSKNTSKGDRNFDLYINDKKALTFSTFKDKSISYWTYSGPGGEAVVFEWKTDDGAGDAHGYMYLKVPVSAIEKGKPVRLRIVGQAANSRDWYMTFKYEFAETIQVTPISLVTCDGRQPVQVTATHFGNDLPITLVVDGSSGFRFTLKPGLNSFEIYHKVVDTLTQVKIEAIMPGLPVKEFMVILKPVTYREIHLIHHSHYDVGYSHLQEEVLQIHNQNIANALRHIEQTRNLPEEARFKWNIETTLAIENFMKIATPKQKEKLLKAIKEGSIGIGGLYANITTGICQPEELFNLTMHARQLEKEMGILIPAAMISDIPGLTWATIPALARSGIRYFSDGPNYITGMPDEGDRVGNSNKNWKDRPFWWVSPSGNEKLLFWMAGKGYSSWHGFKAGDISARGKKKISAYMDELDTFGYPYEMVQWRYNIVADNGPTDSLISRFVMDWNNQYSSPKIILNTIDKMFSEFEEKYGDKLPVFSGDLTPYWEDGAYSTAAEMAMNRRNSEKLTSLSILYSLASPGTYPGAAFNQAWKSVLLWDEHTWGAFNSISDPDIPFVTNQWKYKQQYALAADSLLREIEKPLFSDFRSSLPEKVDVFNTASWERTDVVYLDKDISVFLKEVTDEDGQSVAFQNLSDGRVAFLATIPAMGAKRFTLARIDRNTEINWGKSSVSSIENRTLIVQMDKTTGSLQSLIYKPLHAELVNREKYSGLNEYLYVPGKDPKTAVTNGRATLSLKENGPVLTTIMVESDAPGCNRLIREITLFKDINRIEIANTVDKKAIREKESLHFAFPFAVEQGQERFNTGWGGIFQPGINQLAGANQDYYSVQQWCDVSNQNYGVSLLLREACLIEPGAIINELPGKFGGKSWKTEPDLTPTLYSYVMNNYWHTNFKADQAGPVTFTYALVPHGIFNLGEVQKQGIAFNQPLIVLPASGDTPVFSLFTISNPNVIATSVIPTSKGFKVRLFNAGGAPEAFRIEWKAYKPVKIKVFNQFDKAEDSKPDEALSLTAFGIMDMEVFK